MSEVLLLNSSQIDLDENSLTRKIRIADIFSVSERKSSFSYTIKIPRTANNVQVLDMLGVNGNTSRKPYELIRADYIVDGINIVRNGFAVVKSETFELNIYDGILSLASLFGDKLLSDLNLESLNHELTVQNYLNSFSNTEGFIYAFADFGRGVGEFKDFNEVVVPVPYEEVLTVNIEKQAPSVFVHTLFRSLFESNGLELIGGFFEEDEEYLKELIVPSLGYEVDLYGLENEKIARFRSSKNRGSFELDDVEIGQESRFVMNEKNSDGSFEVNEDGDLVVLAAGVYRFDLEIEIEKTDPGVESFFDVYVNNSDSGVGAFLREDVFSQRVVLTLVEGDVVSFRYVNFLLYSGDKDAENYESFYQYKAIMSFDVNRQGGTQIIKPIDYLPKMKQIDFFKEVVERYGLVLSPVSGTDNFEFKKIDNILKDREGAEDWSDKLIGKKGESYDSGYSQINKATFKYEEEEEDFAQDGFFEVDDKNASYENEIIESNFKIPLKSEEDEDIEAYMFPIWKNEEEVRVHLFSQLQEVEKFQNTSLSVEPERIDVDGVLSPESYYEGGLIAKEGYVVKKYRVSDFLRGVVGYASGAMENFLDPVSLSLDAEGVIRSYGTASEINRWERSNQLYIKIGQRPVIDYFNIEYVYLLGTTDFEPFIFYSESTERNTAENSGVDASLMSLKKVQKAIAVRKFDSGVYTSFAGFVPELSLDNISMQYAIDKNYGSFVNLMNDFKSLMLEVNLSTNDIYNLNFFRLKYFKSLGKYYYLNSVTNRKGGDSEIEVLEVRKFKN